MIPPRKMGSRTDVVTKTKTTTRIGTPRHQYISPTDVVHSIFGGKVSIESKRERKLLKRACLNVDSTDGLVADLKFPPWSHREISFNRKDQWAAIPEPGRFPPILDPYMNSVKFERVLVDGGSSIDILFCNSLPALKITPAQLKPYDGQFWGVLPGQNARPLSNRVRQLCGLRL